MQLLLYSVLISVLPLLTNGWETDFDKAKQAAGTEHKLILLNFSGSDWCAPCIRMHKEIFENTAFVQYAEEQLVLVNADFPRLKKHQLPPEQLKKNNQLAEMYNKEGEFPLTLLLTADGKVLKTWQGYTGSTADAFINQVKAAIDARK